MITNFHFIIKTSLKERIRLKKFLKEISKRENVKIESLDIVFCTDEYLLSINRSFLNHDFYTDIITFDLTPKESTSKIAEIYISTERVRDNAQQHNSTFKRELHRVIFHGILHLSGYKDKKTAEKILMRKKEEEYLIRYFKK